VAENIATVPLLLGWDGERIRARVEELMSLFQLDPAEFAGRYPHELSGGQQQRVGVARALAAGPNVLLMDEPFGALDPIIRNKAQEDLLAIQKRLGTTIVLVTHDMEEAVHMGDRIAVMDGGRLLQYDTPDRILAHPASTFVDTLVGARSHFACFRSAGWGTPWRKAGPKASPSPPTPASAMRWPSFCGPGGRPCRSATPPEG
jgi:osmoprotectant transport system ATP-binding protein